MHTFYHNDCRNVLRDLETGSFESVVADPPYGAGVASWDSVIPPQEILDESLRVARGPVVWFGAAPTKYVQQFMQYDPCPDRMLVWHIPYSTSHTAANGMFFKYHFIYVWRPPKKTPGIHSDVLVHNTERRQHALYHPGMKPLSLMVQLVRGFGGGSVLDMFMGSGTTGRACAQFGWDFAGMEINQEYFDYAKVAVTAAYNDAYSKQLF